MPDLEKNIEQTYRAAEGHLTRSGQPKSINCKSTPVEGRPGVYLVQFQRPDGSWGRGSHAPTISGWAAPQAQFLVPTVF